MVGDRDVVVGYEAVLSLKGKIATQLNMWEILFQHPVAIEKGDGMLEESTVQLCLRERPVITQVWLSKRSDSLKGCSAV